MPKEFNLSEQIVNDPRSEHVGYIHVGWVKDFVKLLLENAEDCSDNDGHYLEAVNIELIKELAGEVLK